MLNFLIVLYNRLPFFLQDLLKPFALRFHNFFENTFYHKNQDSGVLLIPYIDSNSNLGYLKYNHKLIVSPLGKQFRNNFFPNDYSEIEEKVSEWDQKPSLKASLIVASYNQKDTLKFNLLAWMQQSYPLDLIEVIVSDDGSSDGTQELVNSLRAELPYTLKFYTQEDKGFRLSKVRNEGVALSEGDVVFFIDADTIPSREYINEHMKYYHVSDYVAVVGLRHRIENSIDEDTVLNKEKLDSLKKLPMIEDKDAPLDVRRWRKNILFNKETFKKQWTVWGGFQGNIASCRRQDYICLGGNDENFTSYGQEDSEFGFRLMSKIKYLVSNPNARIYHIEHPSHPQKLDPHNTALLKEKTKGPIVTVYIPAYNAEEHIEDSIESVLNQTFQDFELIVVNDGSSDNTKSILEKYRYHPKIRIYNQIHKGIGSASNLAVLYSRGEYISPLNQNGLLMPDALEIFVKEFENNNIGLIYAGYIDIRNGIEFPQILSEYKPGSLLCQKVNLPMMWKKYFFFKTEGFNERLSSCTEYDIALKLEEVSCIKQLGYIVYKNRDFLNTKNQIKSLINISNMALKRRGLMKLKAISCDENGAIVFTKT